MWFFKLFLLFLLLKNVKIIKKFRYDLAINSSDNIIVYNYSYLNNFTSFNQFYIAFWFMLDLNQNNQTLLTVSNINFKIKLIVKMIDNLNYKLVIINNQNSEIDTGVQLILNKFKYLYFEFEYINNGFNFIIKTYYPNSSIVSFGPFHFTYISNQSTYFKNFITIWGGDFTTSKALINGEYIYINFYSFKQSDNEIIKLSNLNYLYMIKLSFLYSKNQYFYNLSYVDGVKFYAIKGDNNDFDENDLNQVLNSFNPFNNNSIENLEYFFYPTDKILLSNAALSNIDEGFSHNFSILINLFILFEWENLVLTDNNFMYSLYTRENKIYFGFKLINKNISSPNILVDFQFGIFDNNKNIFCNYDISKTFNHIINDEINNKETHFGFQGVTIMNIYNFLTMDKIIANLGFEEKASPSDDLNTSSNNIRKNCEILNVNFSYTDNHYLGGTPNHLNTGLNYKPFALIFFLSFHFHRGIVDNFLTDISGDFGLFIFETKFLLLPKQENFNKYLRFNYDSSNSNILKTSYDNSFYGNGNCSIYIFSSCIKCNKGFILDSQNNCVSAIHNYLLINDGDRNRNYVKLSPISVNNSLNNIFLEINLGLTFSNITQWRGFLIINLNNWMKKRYYYFKLYTYVDNDINTKQYFGKFNPIPQSNGEYILNITIEGNIIFKNDPLRINIVCNRNNVVVDSYEFINLDLPMDCNSSDYIIKNLNCNNKAIFLTQNNPLKFYYGNIDSNNVNFLINFDSNQFAFGQYFMFRGLHYYNVSYCYSTYIRYNNLCTEKILNNICQEIQINKCGNCNNDKKNLLIGNNKFCMNDCPTNTSSMNILDNNNNIIGQKCCDNNCLDCIDFSYNSCTKCPANKFLKIINFNNWTGECIVCNANSFFQNNQCRSCIINCFYCVNVTECIDCNSNYYLTSDKNCSLCNYNGYFKNLNKCEKCKNNCDKCTSTTNCQLCSRNYYLSKNDTCVLCNLLFEVVNNIKCEYSIPKCLEYNGNLCKKCNIGYFGYYCKNCDPNCFDCLDSVNNCIKCKERGNLVDTKNNKKVCYYCKEGEFLYFKNLKCYKCEINKIIIIYKNEDIPKEYIKVLNKQNNYIIIKIPIFILASLLNNINKNIKISELSDNNIIIKYQLIIISFELNSYKKFIDSLIVLKKSLFINIKECILNETKFELKIKNNPNNFKNDLEIKNENFYKIKNENDKKNIDNLKIYVIDQINKIVEIFETQLLLFSIFNTKILIDYSRFLPNLYILFIIKNLPLDYGINVNTFFRLLKINTNFKDYNNILKINENIITNKLITKLNYNIKLLNFKNLKIYFLTYTNLIIAVLLLFIIFFYLIKYFFIKIIRNASNKVFSTRHKSQKHIYRYEIYKGYDLIFDYNFKNNLKLLREKVKLSFTKKLTKLQNFNKLFIILRIKFFGYITKELFNLCFIFFLYIGNIFEFFELKIVSIVFYYMLIIIIYFLYYNNLITKVIKNNNNISNNEKGFYDLLILYNTNFNSILIYYRFIENFRLILMLFILVNFRINKFVNFFIVFLIQIGYNLYVLTLYTNSNTIKFNKAKETITSIIFILLLINYFFKNAILDFIIIIIVLILLIIIIIKYIVLFFLNILLTLFNFYYIYKYRKLFKNKKQKLKVTPLDKNKLKEELKINKNIKKINLKK